MRSRTYLTGIRAPWIEFIGCLRIPVVLGVNLSRSSTAASVFDCRPQHGKHRDEPTS
jgi:hypothetical protein